MVTAHIDAATAAEIKAERAALFADAKLLGRTESLVFWRDYDNNADGVTVPAQEVLVKLVGGSGKPGVASRQSGVAAQITGSTGELRKEAPFNVRNGDRFSLPETYPGLGGVNCVVTGPPVDAGAYIAAPFQAVG